MGFTPRSLPHTMTNPGKADLVYLVGGTRKPFDVSNIRAPRSARTNSQDMRHTGRFQRREIG
jgi:uncharacterized cupin superfamily protein